jgi:hypothetical protein
MICSICHRESGDPRTCTNPECVCSSRLPALDEPERVDTIVTAQGHCIDLSGKAGGHYWGGFVIHDIDPEWEKRVAALVDGDD